MKNIAKGTINRTVFIGITASTLALATHASAQNIAYQNSSVTVYDIGAGAINVAPPQGQAYQTTTNAVQTYQPAQAPITKTAPSTPKAKPQTSPSPAADLSNTGLWGAEWSGRANIGASLQTGNTEQNAINADASVKAKWNDEAGETKHRASAKAEINRETEDDETTEDNRTLKFAYDYFLNNKWFVNSTLGFEQDDLDELDLRTDLGIGIGHQPFESDELNLQYILGPSYLREEFASGETEDSLAARWSLEYDQKIWDDVLQVFHEHELFVPADDTNAYLLDTKTGLRIPLKKGLVATGEIEFDRDNAPEEGVEKDDTTYSVKLGYEW